MFRSPVNLFDRIIDGLDQKLTAFNIFRPTAKCPNCGHQGPWAEGIKWWKFNPTWPCKKCGSMLKDDYGRRLSIVPLCVAFLLFLEFWIKPWSLFLYCLCMPLNLFIFSALQRVKIVQSSDRNSDSDNPKVPFKKERR